MSPKKIENQQELINFINKSFKYISFNKKDSVFFIKNRNMTYEIDTEISDFVKLMSVNKKIINRLCNISLGSITLEYYDRCMVNYCEQVIDNKKKNRETCWAQNANKYISLGYYNKQHLEKYEIIKYLEKVDSLSSRWILNIINDELIKKNFHVVNGWLLYNGKLRTDNFSFINNFKSNLSYYLIKLFDYKKDRIINTVNSITKRGWDEELAWSQTGVVLYKSNNTGKISCITGRHRLCAAVYLAKKGILNRNQKIFFPILTGNFDYIRTSNRPSHVACMCS